MKNYSFVILDDENQHTQSGGWKRVFDLFLIPKNYIKKKSTDITLSDNSTFIKNAEPLEVQFFKPENDSYSAVYEKISNVNFQEKKDIYFIDMNWNNADSIKGTNVEEKNLEEITFSDITKGKTPSVLAGLNLLNILPKNDKPKIVFSGSDKTENIRKVFKLLSNRVLTDDILIGEMTGGGTNNYIDEVERKVDTYLQSRQIAIINRQTANKIQELNEIVKEWNGNVDNADKLLIPDNGTETNPENCWSLRTLFPKQVNRIELGMDVEKNKEDILECLNNLSFPAIYDWLVHHHGNIKGKEYAKIKIDKVVQDRFASLPSFNLLKSDKIPYKDFSEIIDYENYDFITVRDMLFRGTNFQSILPENQVVTENCGLNNIEAFKLSENNKQNSPAIRQMAEYGLYIGDLKLFYDIIESNAKYNFSDKFKSKNEQLPKPKLVLDYCNNTITVRISYYSDPIFFKSATVNLKPVHDKMNSLLTNKSSWNQIDQLGPSQIFKVLSHRYKTSLEMRIGKFSFTASRDSISEILEKYQTEETYFQFKLNKVSSL